MSKETVVYEDGPIEETEVKETKKKSLLDRVLFFQENHPKITKCVKTVGYAVRCGFTALGVASAYAIIKYSGSRGNTDSIESAVDILSSDTDTTTE